MALCKDCRGVLKAGPSCFEGWDLLACVGCGRPIRLLPLGSRSQMTRGEVLALRRREVRIRAGRQLKES